MDRRRESSGLARIDLRRLAAIVMVAVWSSSGWAIQTCELDGQSINPNNGSATAGKSGLMRCRDADTGAVTREQQLQNGRFIGVVRYFKAGQVEREFTVDERGNKDGVSREWNVADANAKRVLVREETERDGHTVGLARTWYPSGQRRRLTFYGDDGREQAFAGFTADGRLAELHCASRAVFGADFDDRAACGFIGAPLAVVLYGGGGQPAARVVFERGEQRRVETLWESGGVRQLREVTASGGLERDFSADGTKRRELQWTTLPRNGGDARPRNVDTLEQEFHESGKLVHERRWTPTDDGADLVAERWWFLNGQVRESIEYAVVGGRRTRRDTSYHDNGKLASDGRWLVGDARGDRGSQPTGVHRSYDDEGRVRGERIYDDRGRLTRERALDEHGGVTHDDEVFEDGSRKSVGR